MSWSFQCIGKPAGVVAALEKHSDSFSGNAQSKLEFDDAKPHLIALVSENFVTEGHNYHEPLIDFEASESGSASAGVQHQRQLAVSIKPIWKTLV
jgi:hypothetical protein